MVQDKKTEEETADILGRQVSTVVNRLRKLKIQSNISPEERKQMLKENQKIRTNI